MSTGTPIATWRDMLKFIACGACLTAYFWAWMVVAQLIIDRLGVLAFIAIAVILIGHYVRRVVRDEPDR